MKILINSCPSPETELAARIRTVAPDAVLHFSREPSASNSHIVDADIVAGAVDVEGLARQRRLRWVHSWAAGPDSQLFPAFAESDIVLTCSKGNGAIPLAEHAMMLMLMLNRQALRYMENQNMRRWDRYVHGELKGLTCGIIGVGHSGKDLARKAKAFHMTVIGLRRQLSIEPEFDGMFGRAEMTEFLGASDFVVVTAPRTKETVGMLGEAEFRRMKRSAFYICISRGGIADDAALLRALTEGWIAGAGLDAHSLEPLPSDSPYWTAPNTIVTPHNGAVTPNTVARGQDIFIENLLRFVEGRPLVNVVDKGGGY